MKILLVRPSYPSSRNNVYKIPIGLCKLSAYHKSIGDFVFYVEGTVLDDNIPYTEIDTCYVTTLFTYWSSISIDTINFYKKICTNAKIVAGGIYASISPNHLKENSLVDEIIIGTHPIAETYLPDYSILPTDNAEINNTQIIWASRGCRRRCGWCFAHVIEPDVYFKSTETIEKELYKNKDRKNVLLYDNSILQHPDIKRLLNIFNFFHKKYGYVYNATQGIDGRMLKQWEEKGIPIANLMKKAGFYDLRFSYDHEGERDSAFYCINSFEKAGYKRNEMQVFCIINNLEPPRTIEKRYFELYNLGVQIHSDVFKPSNLFSDKEDFINTEHGWDILKIKGILRLMSNINYANRMGCMLVESESMQNSKELNKGKSSHKIDKWL